MQKLIIYCITLCLINSCYRNGEPCEAFNFSRLPFDKLYFENQLKYTNGSDTLTLYPSGYYTHASTLNPMANPICNPSFEIDYSAKKGNNLHFLYSFGYYPENENTDLYISVNGNEIIFDVDSIVKRKIELNEEQIFSNFAQRDGVDSTRAIKSLVFCGLRIIEVEKLTGEKWKLING